MPLQALSRLNYRAVEMMLSFFNAYFYLKNLIDWVVELKTKIDNLI
jgi:hypothetical protein